MSAPTLNFRAIREQVAFEDVLDRYGITLGGKGPQRLAICPFHPDRIASLSVNVRKKVFHCFGCGAQGDVFDFVARKENVPLPEAARIVAERCGIPVEGRRPTAQESGEERRQARRDGRQQGGQARKTATGLPGALESTERGNQPLSWQLHLEPDHPYLRARGLSPELAREFGLGYCARGSMTGRICIPIHDDEGALVAYAGRWADTDLPDGVPRYKLPRGFRKSRVLFNLHRVSTADHLILVEGYWSVFCLHSLGLPAVALMGRTLSAMQEELLACSSARFLTVLMDGDEPGRTAAQELLPRLSRNWFVNHAELPDGEEPDTAAVETLRRILWLP